MSPSVCGTLSARRRLLELEVRRRAVREFDMWVDSGDVADTTKFQACVQFMMSSQKNAASFDLFVIVEGKYRL